MRMIRFYKQSSDMILFKSRDVSAEPRNAKGEWEKGGSTGPRKNKPIEGLEPGMYHPLHPEWKPLLNDDRLTITSRGGNIPKVSFDVNIYPVGNDREIIATYKDQFGNNVTVYTPQAIKNRWAKKLKAVETLEKNLPSLRNKVEKDLSANTMAVDKMNAAIAMIIDKESVRVGSDQYAKKNNTYGASSIEKRHVSVKGNSVNLHFRGKDSQEWNRTIISEPLAKLMKQLATGKAPGDKLFQSTSADGKQILANEGTISEYMKPFGVTPKDFRTYHACRIALDILGDREPAKTVKEAKAGISEASTAASIFLGNLEGTCRDNYIDPEIFKNYCRELTDDERAKITGVKGK